MKILNAKLESAAYGCCITHPAVGIALLLKQSSEFCGHNPQNCLSVGVYCSAC